MASKSHFWVGKSSLRAESVSGGRKRWMNLPVDVGSVIEPLRAANRVQLVVLTDDGHAVLARRRLPLVVARSQLLYSIGVVGID